MAGEPTVGKSDPPAAPRVPLHGFVNAAGAASMAVAALALLGWALDADVLKSLLPGHSPMKANTAVCLVAAGAALVCGQSRRPVARHLSFALSFGVLLLGALTLVEYASDVDLRIDTLLFDDPDARLEGRPPGRMSQISAFAFVLIGWLGVRRSDARVWAGQTLALAVVAIGLFALSAYGYAMGTGSREAPFNPISVHTAVLLLLLGIGWLASQPQVGVMRVLSAPSFGGELARRTLLPALLIPAVLSYGAQLLRNGAVLSDGAIITLLAVSSGVAVAAMIWWASALLDRVETQRRVTHQLRDSANTDALTGLGNRRAFDAALARLLAAHGDGGGTPFSLLLIDLDHFKAYNDSFGHPAGDEALRQAGQLLGLALRPGDIACRYGGEEFAVLLPGATAAGATGVAERIVRDVRGGLWTHRPVTASVGATTVRAGDDANRLVERADAALYAAKRGGRDRAVFSAG